MARGKEDLWILSSKTTILEDIKEAVTTGSLNMLKGGQLLTVTALVSNVEPAKEVVKRTTNEITVTEWQLTDPTGTIKLVLWEEFVKQVSNGDTCKFENVRLKTD